VMQAANVMAAVKPSGLLRALSTVARARLREKILKNEAECRSHLRSGRFLLMYRDQAMLDKRSRSVAWLDRAQANEATPSVEESFVFLGLEKDTNRALFAIPVEDTETATMAAGGGDFLRFLDLRRAMFSVKGEDADDIVPALSKARSVLRWHRKNTFCGVCGHKTARTFTGDARKCSNCGDVQYPPISPVGIVLLAAADNSRALLIRQPRYPPGMFSCVAGFVDAGESLETCVRREVAEEVGLEVTGDVLVAGSQHWPFPAGSLMVGCVAEVDATAEPDPCPEEIEEARWFSPEELRKALKMSTANPELRLEGIQNGTVFVPPPEAIAHHLIKAWLNQHHGL